MNQLGTGSMPKTTRNFASVSAHEHHVQQTDSVQLGNDDLVEGAEPDDERDIARV